MMNYPDLIKTRYSVRDYSDAQVEEEKLRMVLEAGRVSPTATNAQPQRVYVLKSKEAIDKIRSLTKMAFNAPIVLMIGCDMDVAWKSPFTGDSIAETDAAIVTTQMMLQAADIGLGTCWVGYFDPAEVAEAFYIPKNVKLYALLPLGYPAEGNVPSPRHEDRLPLEATVTEL